MTRLWDQTTNTQQLHKKKKNCFLLTLRIFVVLKFYSIAITDNFFFQRLRNRKRVYNHYYCVCHFLVFSSLLNLIINWLIICVAIWPAVQSHFNFKRKQSLIVSVQSLFLFGVFDHFRRTATCSKIA